MNIKINTFILISKRERESEREREKWELKITFLKEEKQNRNYMFSIYKYIPQKFLSCLGKIILIIKSYITLIILLIFICIYIYFRNG